MIDKILITTQKILLYLIPIGLITGPFIPDLSISLMALIFIFLSIKNNLWNYYYNNKFVKFFLLFNLFLIISSLTSDDILFSLKSSFTYFRFLIFSLSLWYLLENTKDLFMKNYSTYLFILFLVLSLDAIYQFIFVHNILGFELVQSDRISGFFNDRMVLGSFFIRMCPLVIVLFFIFSELKNKILLSIILYTVGITTIILSGERTSLGLFFIFLFLILILNRNKSFFLTFLVLPLFIIISFSAFNKKIQYRLFIEPLQQSNLISNLFVEKYFPDNKKNYVHEGKSLVIFSREHTSHYKTAFKIFLDNPFLGIGPKMFRKKCGDEKYNSGDESCSTHPHNFLLQILSETGIIGFIFYLILLYFIISKLIFYFNNNKNNQKDNYIEIICLITFFINVFPFVPTGNIFNNWLAIIFYFPCGFYLHQTRLKNRDEYVTSNNNI